MKYGKTILLLVGALCSLDGYAGKVTQGNDGMFWKTYDSRELAKFMYQVDIHAQQCFAIFMSTGNKGGGLTEISCAKLALRPEWKEVITWETK